VAVPLAAPRALRGIFAERRSEPVIQRKLTHVALLAAALGGFGGVATAMFFQPYLQAQTGAQLSNVSSASPAQTAGGAFQFAAGALPASSLGAFAVTGGGLFTACAAPIVQPGQTDVHYWAVGSGACCTQGTALNCTCASPAEAPSPCSCGDGPCCGEATAPAAPAANDTDCCARRPAPACDGWSQPLGGIQPVVTSLYPGVAGVVAAAAAQHHLAVNAPLVFVKWGDPAGQRSDLLLYWLLAGCLTIGVAASSMLWVSCKRP
jgi:hypothetical protein